MDSTPRSAPFSSPIATPSKVSLSTSSGSSLPIRAPLTVDSDFEYSASTNGYENHDTSSESSGFESEGFVSGEDDFETASERPFFADPDDETLVETHVVEQYGVSRPFVSNQRQEIGEDSGSVMGYDFSRPFVTDPYGEIREDSGGVKDNDFSRPFVNYPYGEIREENVSVMDNDFSRPFVSDQNGESREGNGGDEDCTVSRPLVIDTDEETIATSAEEEDECFYEPGGIDVEKVGVPIAMLSRDSDDDSVGTEEGDDYGFSGAVRVPGIHTFRGSDSSIKVEGFGVEEEEEELQFEPALEAEGEGCIGVQDSVIDNASVSSELITDEVPVDAEVTKLQFEPVLEAEGEGCIGVQDSVVDNASVSSELITDEVPVDAEVTKLETLVAKKDGVLHENSEINEDASRFVDGSESESLAEVGMNCQNSENKVVDVSNHTLPEGINEQIIESGVESHNFVDCSSVEPADNVVAENGIQNEEEKDKEELQFEPTLEAEGEGCIGVQDSVVDNASVSSELITDEVPVDAEVTKLETLVAKKDGVLHKNSEINEDASRLVDGSESESLAKVGMNCQNSENKVVDVSNHALPEGINEQIIESGVELHNFVDCSSVEPVDNVIAENGIQNTDSRRISEPHSVQDGDGLSLQTSEHSVMENGLHGDQQSLGSNLEPEIALKAELEDEAAHDSGNSEDDFEDFRGLVIGDSDKTKIIVDDVGQRLTPTSLGESPQDLEQKTGVDTNEESDGKELFERTIWAALLKAAAGDGSGGGNFAVTTGNGPRVVSFQRPANDSELPTSSGGEYEETISEEEKKKIEKMQMIRVKFLRLVHRLGMSNEDSIASQVLYRLVLAAGRPTSQSFSFEMANRKAMRLEAEGKTDLDFSLNILVLGKTGVGKSATINSIFGEKKAIVNAFEPGTTSVKNIVGTIDGINFRIFDTPGFRSSLLEPAVNRKILLSIRKLIKKFPPDVVLYVDRLDTQTKDFNDLPLLRSITTLLGSSIWHKSIITLTHAASNPPDGPTGSPVSYDLFVAQRSRVIHQLISQAVGDLRLMSPSLMSPVTLVENHPSCQESLTGQMVLPNGESWRPQLLLLCCSIKILTDANSVVKTEELSDNRKLFGFRVPSLQLPYFLSSLLQSNTHPELPNERSGDIVDSDTELADFSSSDKEDEDEYDLQLPPFKPLKKEQIAKLSKEHREAYFEEYDYRVRHLQRKQLREEVKRLRELKKNTGKDDQHSHDGYMEEDGDDDSGHPSAVAVPLPDRELPPSFDGGNPAYRYRFLESTSHLLTRPLMDSHSWDHDCGYDTVSLESNLAIAGRFPSVIAVQIMKDKKDFNIHLDSSVAMKHGEGGSTMAGLNIQHVGKQLAYILKGETKVKILKRNKTSAGVSVTFLGGNIATGMKIEDQITIGKRLVLVGSSGIIRSQGDTACGGNFELRLREKDFPIGQDQTTVSLSLMRWRGEVLWGGNMQSQFSIGRSSKVVFRAGLNSKLSGQVSVRVSSSDQLQIALLGILPVASAIFRDFFPGQSEKYIIQ